LRAFYNLQSVMNGLRFGVVYVADVWRCHPELSSLT
jgi:hypothetical protein